MVIVSITFQPCIKCDTQKKLSIQVEIKVEIITLHCSMYSLCYQGCQTVKVYKYKNVNDKKK
jgi:transcription elongation factor Elf1